MAKKKTESLGPTETLPVLPLRDIVVFPHMIVPLFVGREKSIKALEEVMREDKRIMLVAQKNAGDDDPAIETIYEVGTLAQVLQLLKLTDGTVKVLVEGVERVRTQPAHGLAQVGLLHQAAVLHRIDRGFVALQFFERRVAHAYAIDLRKVFLGCRVGGGHFFKRRVLEDYKRWQVSFFRYLLPQGLQHFKKLIIVSFCVGWGFFGGYFLVFKIGSEVVVACKFY